MNWLSRRCRLHAGAALLAATHASLFLGLADLPRTIDRKDRKPRSMEPIHSKISATQDGLCCDFLKGRFFDPKGISCVLAVVLELSQAGSSLKQGVAQRRLHTVLGGESSPQCPNNPAQYGRPLSGVNRPLFVSSFKLAMCQRLLTTLKPRASGPGAPPAPFSCYNSVYRPWSSMGIRQEPHQQRKPPRFVQNRLAGLIDPRGVVPGSGL